ncbi:MAG: winged helix-turn-helix domain-containing protein, partial [Carnobacterium sp.]
VMVFINHLRNKIEDDPKNVRYLQTVWGIGYMFDPNSN